MPAKSAHYNHLRESVHTRGDADRAVGKLASITFTGVIVDSGYSDTGPFVRFKPSERFGLHPDTRFTMDLDPFELHDE